MQAAMRAGKFVTMRLIGFAIVLQLPASVRSFVSYSFDGVRRKFASA